MKRILLLATGGTIACRLTDEGLAEGVIQGYDMTTEAAVTKLMWTLGQTGDPNEVRAMFSRSLAGERSV